MPLKKSTGNMYPWVTHTHAHLAGECPHKCSYCYVDHPRFGRPARYTGPVRMVEKELLVNYGSGKTIFIENTTDLFAREVPYPFIQGVMSHCRMYPLNTYVFQTKNPERMYNYLPDMTGLNVILGVTIESNRHYPAIMGETPHPMDRIRAMRTVPNRPTTFLTIEPIMDFDGEFVDAIIKVKPDFVNIGADSKNHGLPEPSSLKVFALECKLTEAFIEVRRKANLERLK